MCAMAVAPREMARDVNPSRVGAPAPIYVVCSPGRRVGKTLMARLLIEDHVADGRTVGAYDLSDESPQLTDYLPHHAAPADIADIRGQMALFDGLIADGEMPKVIDVGHRAFWRFFAVVHRIGFFEEARGRGIEPVILFIADADPRTERAYTLLQCSFPDTPLLHVRKHAAAPPDSEAVLHASASTASIEIAELPPSLRNLVDRPGFSFADFPQRPPGRLSVKAQDELLVFIGRVHAQLREIELGLFNEQALAGLQ
jgi:hypothetical protein